METTVTTLNKLVSDIQTRLNEALHAITRMPVNLNLSHSGLLPINDAQKILETIPGRVTTVYIPIINEVTGDIFVFLPTELSFKLADILIGQPLGTTKMIGEFESSAIKEFGNITFGVIITQMANALKLPIMLTVPNLATDMANALLDQVLIEYGESAPDMLAIQMPFTIDTIDSTGTFLILFDQKSSDLISEKLPVDSIPSDPGKVQGAVNG